MFNTIFGAGAVGAGAASRYGSGSDQKMRLLAAPAPLHCYKVSQYFLIYVEIIRDILGITATFYNIL
jgi:hypothetical protein